jgi:hypothetical protein
MDYSWSETFSLDAAMAGGIIGFHVSGSDWDLSQTGRMESKNPPYSVIINGITMQFDSAGKVFNTKPSTPAYHNTYLKNVSADMANDGAVGTGVTRSSGSSGTGHTDQAVLSSVEPRDAFAMNVLNAMMVNMKRPETFDDATKLMYSRAAYKWAQAMMIAAADGREGQVESGGSSTPVNVNSGDLQSNTEALLYNINQALQPLSSLATNTQGGFATLFTAMSSRIGDVATNVGYVHGDLTPIKDAYTIPNKGNISIVARRYQTKYIQLEFQQFQAYSDLSVKFSVDASDGSTTTTRNIGFVVPKGTVIVVITLDPDIVSISSINSATIAGQASNDLNNYSITVGS